MTGYLVRFFYRVNIFANFLNFFASNLLTRRVGRVYNHTVIRFGGIAAEGNHHDQYRFQVFCILLLLLLQSQSKSVLTCK